MVIEECSGKGCSHMVHAYFVDNRTDGLLMCSACVAAGNDASVDTKSERVESEVPDADDCASSEAGDAMNWMKPEHVLSGNASQQQSPHNPTEDHDDEDQSQIPSPGDAVELKGLKSATNLNGCRGVVLRLVQSSGRYEVQFEGEDATRAVKLENLAVILQTNASSSLYHEQSLAKEPSTEGSDMSLVLGQLNDGLQLLDTTVQFVHPEEFGDASDLIERSSKEASILREWLKHERTLEELRDMLKHVQCVTREFHDSLTLL